MTWMWTLVSLIWLAPIGIALILLGGSMISHHFRAWLLRHLVG